MENLKEYIIALTNLYGMVHKNKAIEIYNSQNSAQISDSDLNEFIGISVDELEDNFIYIHEDYFVHEAIMEFDEFYQTLTEKGNKPHYVPKKNELLKYVDDSYFEKTKQYNNLFKYVKRNFFNGDIEKSEWLCEDIQGYCQFGFKIQEILDIFNHRGISFEDIDQANEVLELIMEVSNNTRMWKNNGHTPNEISEMFDRPNLRPLPEKTRKKIGRNDPCPCGSGKKYKKCCLDS